MLTKTTDGFVDIKTSFGKTYKIFAEDWKTHRKKAHIYFNMMEIPQSDWVYYWEIVGKYGKIYPYGKDGTLGVEINSTWHRELAARLDSILIRMLDCSSESTYRFDPEHIGKVAKVIQARKRRKLSPETRDKLTRQLAKARLKVR